MPNLPASTKSSLTSRLRDRARTRWPQLDAVRVRFRAGFAYVDGDLGDGEIVKLCRYCLPSTHWTSIYGPVDRCRTHGRRVNRLGLCITEATAVRRPRHVASTTRDSSAGDTPFPPLPPLCGLNIVDRLRSQPRISRIGHLFSRIWHLQAVW